MDLISLYTTYILVSFFSFRTCECFWLAIYFFAPTSLHAHDSVLLVFTIFILCTYQKNARFLHDRPKIMFAGRKKQNVKFKYIMAGVKVIKYLPTYLCIET
uniref:Uncharacterized protein n=1 Tax=Cacopsylla melanoneura TaxID=428564 RepID=A0A8D8QZ74_9HEMI